MAKVQILNLTHFNIGFIIYLIVYLLRKMFMKFIKFSPFLLILIIQCFVISCATDSNNEELNINGEFNLEAFENAELYSIKERGGFLMVGNDSGLFAKQKTEDTWFGLIDEEVSIRAFEIISENEIIATLYFNNQDSATIGRTTNFGESWLPYRNGFDPVYNSIPTIMEQSKNDDNTMYAGGSILRVAKSTDNAENWNIVFGSWEGFGSIFFVKSTPENLWTGGSSATFHPLLYKSKDEGSTWGEISVIENIKAIARDVKDINDYVFVGLSGNIPAANIIRRSEDNGETWETVFEGAGIYSFTQSSRNADIIYASGRNSTGTLFFLVSDDFGDTWQTIALEDNPGEIHVNDMVSVMEDGQEVIYLGTNKGLYSFTVE